MLASAASHVPNELIYRQVMLPIVLSLCLLSNGAAIAFGGVAGDALESIAEGTLGRVAERAREDRNRSVLLTQRPFSESHAPLRQIGHRSEPAAVLKCRAKVVLDIAAALASSSSRQERPGSLCINLRAGASRLSLIARSHPADKGADVSR